MTDTELIERVAGIIDPSAKCLHGLRRGGRWLLVLPHEREAFSQALNLYQPQRPAARLMVRGVDLLSRTGCRGLAMARVDLKPVAQQLSPPLAGIAPGSCGILLGSPEHRIRRAITSYRTVNGWEVAKIAFGVEGAGVLEPEAEVLARLAGKTAGVPKLLGLHRGGDGTVLRMPYLSGKPLRPGVTRDALALLDGWISKESPKPLPSFPEWPAIVAALETSDAGKRALDQLSGLKLRPVIRHGDFARWNLLEMDGGKLMAIDWEWGHPEAMPGIDLVHWFAQDARLVHQLPPAAVVRAVERSLEAPRCREYLEKTGWGDDAWHVFLASIAFTVGSKQQANEQVLEAALRAR